MPSPKRVLEAAVTAVIGGSAVVAALVAGLVMVAAFLAAAFFAYLAFSGADPVYVTWDTLFNGGAAIGLASLGRICGRYACKSAATAIDLVPHDVARKVDAWFLPALIGIAILLLIVT